MPESEPATDFGVAIIGMAGRFPGAGTIDEFWRNLLEGRESITAIPGAGPPAAGLLADMDRFDAPLFGYSAREAELLDPQQRLLLETAWHAVESSGYDPTGCPGTVGVYAGTGLPTYLLFNLMNAGRVDLAEDGLGTMMGNDKGFAAARVAYHLDLRGPAMDINTACSTSLVAVVQACESLLGYQCDMALAGGSAVNAAPERGHPHREGGPVSADGHCRPFDSSASGTVFGSGVGVVVLKRLADALADGDPIRAVIRGGAVNNDGVIKVGFAAPGVDGQSEVISRALAMADVPAESVRYVEAHGTGTRLGDPIEVAALSSAFGGDRSGWCALGSLKGNVGHLDAAAGVAGLIKAVLVLEHRVVPPVTHFQEPNPEIDFDASPFFVNRTAHPLLRGDTPLRAGVSSFGFGGTNAHVVLEEAPRRQAAEAGTGPHVLVMSARSADAHARLARELADHLERHPEQDLADVAHTLRTGRRHFDHRASVVCADHATAVRALHNTVSGPRLACEPSVALLIPGQGTQRAGAGLALMDHVPAFRETVDECAEMLAPRLGLDIREALYPRPGRPSVDLDDTSVAQPALFVTGYALATALRRLGVRADALIGHSVGEYLAACLAGVLTIGDALHLVATRARIMSSAPEGTMLAVELAVSDCAVYLADGVEVAAVNSATSTVLSGPVVAMSEVADRLRADGVVYRRLRTTRAFHSATVDDLLPRFRAALAEVTLSAPALPFVSTLTGTWITDDQATDPEHWVRHLRQPVRWHAGMDTLLRTPGRILVDIGVPPSMATLVRHHPAFSSDHRLVRLADRDATGVEPFLRGIGELWAAGAEIDWSALPGGRKPHRVCLPTYPFQRERYWIEPDDVPATSVRTTLDPGEWLHVPSWQRDDSEAPDIEPGQGHRTWLVLAGPGDDSDVAGQLVGHLRRAGDTVLTVAAAEGFTRMGRYAYTVAPTREVDYRTLLAVMADDALEPTHVVHAWGLAGSGASPGAGSAVESGLVALLALARALAGRPVRITVLTTGVEAVVGDEPIDPERATVLGACRVIPQEYPELDCRLVDMVAGQAGADHAATMATRLHAELRRATGEQVVALRGPTRWLPRTVPLRRQTLAPVPRRDRGTYLITGGFGRIGHAVARALSAQDGRLVLVGRTALPDPDAWDAWLRTHDDDDPISRRVRMVTELRAAGAEVLAVAADVTDRDAMAAAVASGRAAFGPYHGVVHCAGTTDAAAFVPIADLDAARIRTIIGPSLAAPRLLDELLAGEATDFRVLTSSLAAVVGGPGLAAYAAGHAYLDAYSTVGERWQTVDWDVWHAPDRLDWRRGEQPHVVDDQRGTDIFSWFAGRAMPRVLVSVSDLVARIERWSGPEGRAHPPQKEELHARPDLGQPFVAPETDLESAIAEVWQQLLRLAPVGVRDNFFELGGDSILGTQLVVRLRAALGREIPLAALFESPTIAGLAAALRSSTQDHGPAIAPLARVARSRKALTTSTFGTTSERNG